MRGGLGKERNIRRIGRQPVSVQMMITIALGGGD